MSYTDLATLVAPKTKPIVTQLQAGDELSDEVKMEAITSVADMMEKGTRSTTAILAFLNTTYGIRTRNTAIKYRNLAMTLLAREHKPMNRENMRALEVGRLQYHIERIYNVILEYEAQTELRDREPKWYDVYAKLWARLNDFGARLHAITGLNEITINNESSTKRIVFVRPGEPMPKSHNMGTSVEDVLEGTIIEAQATT